MSTQVLDIVMFSVSPCLRGGLPQHFSNKPLNSNLYFSKQLRRSKIEAQYIVNGPLAHASPHTPLAQDILTDSISRRART